MYKDPNIWKKAENQTGAKTELGKLKVSTNAKKYSGRALRIGNNSLVKRKMKDEEFKRNLEIILEAFEKIDQEIKQSLSKEKINSVSESYNSKSLSDRKLILYTKYKTKKIATENRHP